MHKTDIEYSALLEEYKCLKSEIAANLASSRQATNLTLVALGLVAGGAKALTEAGSYWPLLLGPPVFVAFILSQLRYTYLAVEMSVYIDKKISRKIQALAENQDLMGWESNQSELFLGWRWLPIRGATLLLPLLGAMICLVLYGGIHVQSSNSMSLWPPDPLSILGLIEFALVLGVAVYCLVAGQALERARDSRCISTHVAGGVEPGGPPAACQPSRKAVEPAGDAPPYLP